MPLAFLPSLLSFLGTYWKAFAWVGGVAVIGGAGFVIATHLDKPKIEAARSAQRAAQAQSTIDASQTAAAASAASTAAQEAAAAASSEQSQQEIDHALHSAPGADQRLDPDLGRVGLRGLCASPSFRANAGNAALCAPGPAAVAPAGALGRRAAPAGHGGGPVVLRHGADGAAGPGQRPHLGRAAYRGDLRGPARPGPGDDRQAPPQTLAVVNGVPLLMEN